MDFIKISKVNVMTFNFKFESFIKFYYFMEIP